MSIFDIFKRKPEEPAASVVENSASIPLSTIDSASDYSEWFTGVKRAGVSVNEHTVLNVSSVYACVNLVAGAVASMPLPTYVDKDGIRERVYTELTKILNRRANPSMSAAVFWEYMITSLLLKGDAFAIIKRPNLFSNRITGLEPVHPGRVYVQLVDGDLVYRISALDGSGVKTYNAADIIHIPGPGFNGLRGKSQITHVLTNSAGIALAADQYSANFFSNGAKPDFAIEMEGKPTTEQVEEMRRVWSEKYGGINNSHLPAVLFGGTKVHELTMNAEDAQLIATRQFQVEDVARIFGVPPHMIGHTTNTTSWGSGVENMGIGFVKYTLARHLVKIEQELNSKLFPDGSVFCEFCTSGLERGDYKSRNEGYRIALGRAGEPAWMTVNEVRKLENLPPVDGGDDLFEEDQEEDQNDKKPDKATD